MFDRLGVGDERTSKERRGRAQALVKREQDDRICGTERGSLRVEHRGWLRGMRYECVSLFVNRQGSRRRRIRRTREGGGVARMSVGEGSGERQ